MSQTNFSPETKRLLKKLDDAIEYAHSVLSKESSAGKEKTLKRKLHDKDKPFNSAF